MHLMKDNNIMDSSANVSPSRGNSARASPQIVRARQFNIPTGEAGCRSTVTQPRYNGANDFAEKPVRRTKEENFMWYKDDEPFMRKQPSEVKTAKHLRISNCHQDTPIPPRYLERQSNAIPNGRDSNSGTAIQDGSYFGLTQTNTATATTPRAYHQSRDTDFRICHSNSNDRAHLNYDYQNFRQSEDRSVRVRPHFTDYLDDFRFDSSEAVNQDFAVMLKPDEARFLELCNRETDFLTQEKNNKQATVSSLLPDPGFNVDYRPDWGNPLPVSNSKPQRFKESVAHGKSALNGLQSNVDRIRVNGDLLKETQPELNAYAITQRARSELHRSEATRVQAHYHDNTHYYEEQFAQMRKNPRNFPDESPCTKRPIRGQFSSPNGVEKLSYKEPRQLVFNGNTENINEGLAVSLKRGFVRELKTDLIKSNREQSKDNTRSVVQFVLTGNRPNKEKETDKFITLIDESFADYCRDKELNKRCVIENLENDRTINGVNKSIRTDSAPCFDSAEVIYQPSGPDSSNTKGKLCNKQGKGSGILKHRKESNTCREGAYDVAKTLQHSPYTTLDSYSNRGKPLQDRCSFDQIKRQLFNEAGLSEEKSDVIDGKTNTDGDLSFVRTVYQSVGDKRSVGEPFDHDFVYVVNESAGRLAHNHEKNPKAETILKIQKAQLTENRNNKSPFIRTVYQDCGQNHSRNDDVNSSGRPVSPFSDSIITAVVICSQDRTRHEYLRLRRRDRRLRYLSEPGIFRTAGLRALENMSNSGGSSSCGNANDGSSVKEFAGHSKESELTEHALRAHTLALKANSPNIRRRPTLDQFFGKITEQGLQDNSSEHSDFSCHSDSVLMVQRANKVNLSPVSGLLKDGSKFSNTSSRSQRLKAWKNRHENIFKGKRTAVSAISSEKSINEDETSSDKDEKSAGGTSEKNNNVLLHSNAAEDHAMVADCENSILNTSVEIAQSQGEVNSKVTEQASELMVGNRDMNQKESLELRIKTNFDLNDNRNTINSEMWSARKSAGSDDSFEEVFVEPELLACSPPMSERKSDSTDSSDHANPNQDSLTDGVKGKKDSLDVFVGSASAILERVKRLKLKYHHKTTFNEEKDFNCNLVGKPVKDNDYFDSNPGQICLIPSPTLLKDSPKIKTLDKSDIFNFNRSPESSVRGFDSTMSKGQKNKQMNLKINKRSSCSLEELRPGVIPGNIRSPCYSSEEDIYSSTMNTEVKIEQHNLIEAQKLLKCLDNTVRNPDVETKEEFKEMYRPLSPEKELTNGNGMLGRPPSDVTNVFVTKKEKELTLKDSIVQKLSTLEYEGRVVKDEKSNARDKESLAGFNKAKCLESKQTEVEEDVSRQAKGVCSKAGENNRLECGVNVEAEAVDTVKEKQLKDSEKTETSTDNDQQGNTSLNSTSSLCGKLEIDKVSFGNTSNKPFVVNKTCRTTLCNEEPPDDTNNLTVEQGSCEISPLNVKDNISADLNNTEKAKENKVNGLSSEIEGIIADNTKKISPLIDSKEYIECEEFAQRRDGLSSKANVIRPESKDSTIERVDNENNLNEFGSSNGVSQQPVVVGEELGLDGSGKNFLDINEKITFAAEEKNPNDVINENETSDVDGKDGLSNKSVKKSLIEAFERVLAKDFCDGEDIDQSELKKGYENANSTDSRTISSTASTSAVDETSLKGENINDTDCYKVTIVDDHSSINSEIIEDLIDEESGVDMAHAKGVSDLKRHFEKYQPKGEKAAENIKSSVKKQALNDSSKGDEHVEVKSTVSNARPSKFGALKSMFENEKVKASKLASLRMASPKVPHAVKNAEGEKGIICNQNLVEKIDGVGLSATASTDFNASIDKGKSSSYMAAESHAIEENLEQISMDKDVVEKPNLDPGKTEMLQSSTLRKPAKVPPPVKRKPSLKRKSNEVSAKAEGKIDDVKRITDLQGVAAHEQEKGVAMKEHNNAESNTVVVEEKGTDKGDEGAASKERRILSEGVVPSEVVTKTTVPNGEGTNEKEHIVPNSSSVIEKEAAERKEPPSGNTASTKQEVSNEMTNSINAVKEDQDVTTRNWDTVQEKSAIPANCKVADGNAVTEHDASQREKQTLCGDAFDVDAEESIASLISELENSCILIGDDATFQNGAEEDDIVQCNFDKLADSEEKANRKEKMEQRTDGESRLENSQEMRQVATSETGLKRTDHEKLREKYEIDREQSSLMNDSIVMDNCHGSGGGQKFDNVEEKVSSELLPCGEEKTRGEKDNLGNYICRKDLGASVCSKGDEQNPDSASREIVMEMGQDERRSIDQKSKITNHPICGLVEKENLVTDEKERLKGTVELTEKGNDCGRNKGEAVCHEDNGLLNVGLSEKGHEQSCNRKSLSIRSQSTSSDSSLEDNEPIKSKGIDCDRLPSVGLPALLREGKGSNEEITADKQEHHYISYSRKASDIKSHADIIGMYSKTEEKCNREIAKEHENQGPKSKEQEENPSLIGLDPNKEVTECDAQGFLMKDKRGNANDEVNPADETGQLEDFPVSIASKSTKSHAPIVIQSLPLTSDRTNSANVAKVSPYFHDRSSRKFAEPVSKFGGGIFGNEWLGEQKNADASQDETSNVEKHQIENPIMRNTNTQVQTMQELGKLKIVLKVPKDSLKDDCVDIGVISTDGMSHWQDIEERVTKSLLEYIKLISDECLGLTSKDIDYLQIGRQKVHRGDGKELSFYAKEENMNTCTVQLQKDWMGSAASLAYQLLITKKTLEKYLSLAMKHHCLIFCGPSGTGKSCLASKIAFAVASRINVNANNNIPEPIHAVNVNAERWKALKKIVMHNVSLSMPVVLVIDGFTPEFHEGMESLAMLLKQMDANQIYVIAALHQTTQEVTVKWQNSIRWIWLDNNEEPVRGLLVRYLRKKFLNNNDRSSLPDLFKIADWISSVWKHLNKIIESFHSAEQTIGPAMFFSCPPNLSDVEEWFADMWNYSLAPYILHTLRTGLKLFGQRCEWTDPLQKISETYPWRHKDNLLMNLKKIRKSDVGYWDIHLNDKEANSSSANQIRLMNFLRRLETLVDDKKIVADTKPGTTQRRIYLESTL